ncbi:MAG TPA: hypothetical protein PLA94_15035 [Myxococcota bacterium]|nr:hypothetical protein [Myxococcota bacterium]HND31314.1 hypothetical protein [Myxococcota bacterium]
MSGDIKVPEGALWGPETERARRRHGAGEPLPPLFWRVIGTLLRTSVMASEDRGEVPVDRAEWLAMAAQELSDGVHAAHLHATGLWSDAEVFANAMEVVQNRALECMVGETDGLVEQSLLHLSPPREVELSCRLYLGMLLWERWLPAFHALHGPLERLLSLPADADRAWQERHLDRLADFLGLPLRIEESVEKDWYHQIQTDCVTIAGLPVLPPAQPWPALCLALHRSLA